MISELDKSDGDKNEKLSPKATPCGLESIGLPSQAKVTRLLPHAALLGLEMKGVSRIN